MRRDYAGVHFGRWLVVSISPMWNRDYQLWSCRCACGSVRDVAIGSLRSARSQSCGCLFVEVMSTHGMSGTRTHNTWSTMIQRCTNQNNTNYKNYGGRGITVCDRWRHSFEAFVADMGIRPVDRTIDRINNDGNYEPGNCRWASKQEQLSNRRPYKSSRGEAHPELARV